MNEARVEGLLAFGGMLMFCVQVLKNKCYELTPLFVPAGIVMLWGLAKLVDGR